MPDHISYLIVHNAHSGSSTKIPKPVRFLTLQRFKEYLEESFTDRIIGSTENIFLLTPFGIKLDFAMVNEMTEVFLFDRRLFQKPAESTLVSRYLSQDDSPSLLSSKPQPFSLFKAPKQSRNINNTRELSECFEKYGKWADGIAASFRLASERIDVLIRHINVIFRALNIIFSFASNFAGSTEKSFKSQYNYVKLLAMKSLHKSWKSHFENLEKFPAFRLKDGKLFRLPDFLDRSSMSQAAKFSSENLPQVISKFNDLSQMVNEVNNDRLKVDKFIEAHRQDSRANFEPFEAKRTSLNEDFTSISKEIIADMRSLDSAPSSESQKLYKKHTEMSDRLFDEANSMHKFFKSFEDFRSKLALESIDVLENVAMQQMKCVDVKASMKKLLSTSEKSADKNKVNDIFSQIKASEDMLSLTADLPLLFGFVLIEKRRQFEWHDFYSKGVVTQVSEQLTVIIEHEKILQKLWLKQFGKLINLINPGTDMQAHVPAIDVTLVNSGPSSAQNSVLNWLNECHIERDDVFNYVGLVRQTRFDNSERFAGLLEKSFKDLLASTEKLKKVTKTVASLSSFSISSSGHTSQSLKISRENGSGVDDDADITVIRGLKSRIKKLEDLLHQQQFKNLMGWPVVKSNERQQSDGKASMLLVNSGISSASKNPISLLPRVPPSRKPSQESVSGSSNRKVLDASTTIDKHLDNIRLRREISDLKASNGDLLGKNKLLIMDLEASRGDCEELKRQNFELEQRSKKLKVQKDELELQSGESRRQFDDIKRHNDELQKRIEEHKEAKKSAFDAEISRHEQEIAKLSEKHQNIINDIEKRETNLKESLGAKDSRIADLQAGNRSLRDQLESITSATSKKEENLQDELSMLTAKLGDLQMMNAELLSNMQAKETEFSTERSDREKKVKDLEYKLEEKSEDFEDLMEMTQGKSRGLEDLLLETNATLRSLYSAIGELLRSNLKSFHEFCVILESMGLLLVHELNADTKIYEYRIRRVKGLRSKKNLEGSRAQSERTKSTAVQEITKRFEWISEFVESHKQTTGVDTGADDTINTNDSTHDADALEAETRRLIAPCGEYVFKKDDAVSKVGEFLKIVSFEDNVQLQAHEDGHDISKDSFFSNGIIKRFNDVEGFAKKLTKENKAKTAELTKLSRQSCEKISVKNFQVGDLVLFLPTRIERADENMGPETSITPWTAFNIDAPHYFLDLAAKKLSVSGEEWIVSRVENIAQHVVTEENARDAEANPFSLSIGITWYMMMTEQ